MFRRWGNHIQVDPMVIFMIGVPVPFFCAKEMNASVGIFLQEGFKSHQVF